MCVCARTLLLVKAFSSVMVRRGRGWGGWGGGRESMSHLCCSPFPAAPWLLFFFSFCLISVVSEGSKGRGRGKEEKKKKGVVHDGNMSVFNRPKIGCRIENG